MNNDNEAPACMAIDFLLEMNLMFEVAYYKLPQIWL